MICKVQGNEERMLLNSRHGIQLRKDHRKTSLVLYQVNLDWNRLVSLATDMILAKGYHYLVDFLDCVPLASLLQSYCQYLTKTTCSNDSLYNEHVSDGGELFAWVLIQSWRGFNTAHQSFEVTMFVQSFAIYRQISSCETAGLWLDANIGGSWVSEWQFLVFALAPKRSEWDNGNGAYLSRKCIFYALKVLKVDGLQIGSLNISWGL